MPVITLPDGSTKQFAAPISVAQVAQSIGSGLAKAALAGKINGTTLVDTSRVLADDVSVAIITAKDAEGLDIIRHSTAHLLAQAVKALFPSAQVTIGPVIEHGFYYDFAFERPFTTADLEAIELKMMELVKEDFQITRQVMTRDEAKAFFLKMGETYKAEIIADIPANEELSLYQQGDFIDLCRGPHIPNTGKLKAFKLMKVAGAYWRGNSDNEMLQRIYGTAWADKKSLETYLEHLEQAQLRDHRKLGKSLSLFHLQEEAPGMVFWHPKGWAVWQVLEQYIRSYTLQAGYQEIRTPQMLDRVLWEKSGHWEKFRAEMFTTATENRDYAVKPMSCPCHVLIFNQGLKSYRDLPLRFAEFGTCHRSEPSGTLHGLLRVRSMVQDDGHIFCTEDQIQTEAANFIDQVYAIYQDFGFTDIRLKISTRPEQRVGSDEIWDKAEQCLIQAVESKSIAYELNTGEGAFYGPKIEFSLCDCLERVWQCGTLQVDFSMPGRLEASYVAEDGSRQVPVMLHRAALGSLERFLGILIEHYAGEFPLWLAPIQAVLINITDNQADYLRQQATFFQQAGIRVITDLRNEKMGYKIREQTLQKIPYLLIAGDKELASQTLSVRSRDGRDLGGMPVEQVLERLQDEIDTRGHKKLV